MKNSKDKKNKENIWKYFLIRNKNDMQEDDKQENDDIEESDSDRYDDGDVSSVNFRALIRFLVILLVVGGGAFILYYLTRTNFNSYDVIEDTNIKNSSMLDYIAYRDSLLKYSKDGATYVDEKGEAVWNETFAMKMPAADVCENYAAIADLNGNDVYIFNEEGKVSSSTMPYTISDIAVASQGEFAVILDGDKVNYINLYDKNGEQISEIQTTITQSGYPMDVDLSNDGEKLFSSYLYIDGANIKNGFLAR